MTLKYDNERYIAIYKGKPSEIKRFIETFDRIAHKGGHLSILEEALEKIESQYELEPFHFSTEIYMYYNNKKVQFFPAVNSIEGKKFYFPIIKKLVNKTLEHIVK